MSKLLFFCCLAGLFFDDCLQAEDVIFVAYNLENYVRMDRGGAVNVPKPAAEIAALVGIIASLHPDILGVCELGKPDQLDDFTTRLKTAGLNFPYQEYVEAADADRHLALLSKFPIVARNSQTDLWFELDGTKQYVKRGILDVVLELQPDYRLHLLGAHLKSKRDIPEDQSVVRRQEARLLRGYARKILTAAPEENLLVYGDFNDTIDQASIHEIQGRRNAADSLQPIDLRDSKGEKWTHYWKTADLYSRIDYAMASRGLRPEIVSRKCNIARPDNWNAASDHCPLVVVLHPAPAQNRSKTPR